MATESVATPIKSADWIWTEKDPHERANARLDGINAIAHLAVMAIEDSHPSENLSSRLLFFIAQVAEDVKRDLQAAHDQRRAGKEVQP